MASGPIISWQIEGEKVEAVTDFQLQYSCLENSMDRGAWWPMYSPWGFKESDTTEPLTPSLSLFSLCFDLSFLQPNRAEIHFARLFMGKNRKFTVLLGNQNIYEIINSKWELYRLSTKRMIQKIHGKKGLWAQECLREDVALVHPLIVKVCTC